MVHAGGHTTLPAAWYRAEGMYELERRAIFSKRWLCVSHSLRFQNAGEFVRYEIAGYGFFIIRDRRNELKAFLNVCRHRAYPIMETDSGKASILSCKYHGELKAEENGLEYSPFSRQDGRMDSREISQKLHDSTPSSILTNPNTRCSKSHLHVDNSGWVWANLDSANPPTVPWEEQFSRVDQQPRLEDFTMDNFEFDHSWEMTGAYNWKNIIDNYNEVMQSLHLANSRQLTQQWLQVLPLSNCSSGYLGDHKVGNL